MANENYSFNKIGGSTSAKSFSAQIHRYTDHQNKHQAHSTDFLKITTESNGTSNTNERANLAGNTENIVDENPRKPINLSKDSNTNRSRLARHHLLGERINIKKVFFQYG